MLVHWQASAPSPRAPRWWDTARWGLSKQLRRCRLLGPLGRVGRTEGGQEPGTPRSNVNQNRQARDAIREYERRSGKGLTPDQTRQAHEEFGRHSDANYQDLLDILKDTFGDTK